jgi:hypothetical protein
MELLSGVVTYVLPRVGVPIVSAGGGARTKSKQLSFDPPKTVRVKEFVELGLVPTSM